MENSFPFILTTTLDSTSTSTWGSNPVPSLYTQKPKDKIKHLLGKSFLQENVPQNHKDYWFKYKPDPIKKETFLTSTYYPGVQSWW